MTIFQILSNLYGSWTYKKNCRKLCFRFFLKFVIASKYYSDRDQILMKSFVVKKLRTTCYNPRATGLTEKYNKFIEKYLTSYESFDDEE